MEFLRKILSSGPTSGSLIEGRKYYPLYALFLYAAAFVIASFLVIKLFRYIKQVYAKYKKSGEYITRTKNKQSTPADFEHIGKRCGFSSEEAHIFYDMCSRFRVPNINFSFGEYESVKRYVKMFLDEAAGEKEKAMIFSIFIKIQRAEDAKSAAYSSVTAVPAGTSLVYVDHDGKKYNTHVAANEKQYLIVAIPVNRYGNEVRPKELAKVNFLFEAKNERMCAMENRVICYQEFGGATHICVSHAQELQFFLKHEYFYINQRTACSLTKVVPESKGEGRIEYKDSGEILEAELVNFSGVSCNFSVHKPIGIRVYVKLTFSSNIFDAGKADAPGITSNKSENIIALIMNVASNEDIGMYLMHANFIDLGLKIKNDIYTKIYAF